MAARKDSQVWTSWRKYFFHNWHKNFKLGKKWSLHHLSSDLWSGLYILLFLPLEITNLFSTHFSQSHIVDDGGSLGGGTWRLRITFIYKITMLLIELFYCKTIVGSCCYLIRWSEPSWHVSRMCHPVQCNVHHLCHTWPLHLSLLSSGHQLNLGPPGYCHECHAAVTHWARARDHGGVTPALQSPGPGSLAIWHPGSEPRTRDDTILMSVWSYTFLFYYKPAPNSDRAKIP